MVQNVASPYNQIQLDPLSIKYYFEPAYVNNEYHAARRELHRLLGRHRDGRSWCPTVSAPHCSLTCRTGLLPVSAVARWPAYRCTMTAGLRPRVRSPWQIPAVSQQTTYDVIFANTSGNQTVSFAANVFWAY